MNDEGKIKVVNEKDEEKEYSILVTFDIESKNKSYVLFTDYSKTDDGNLSLYCKSYDKTGEDNALGNITDQEELDIINRYVKKLEASLKSGIKLA